MDVSSFFSPKGNEPGSLWQHIDNLSFSNVFFFGSRAVLCYLPWCLAV